MILTIDRIKSLDLFLNQYHRSVVQRRGLAA